MGPRVQSGENFHLGPEPQYEMFESRAVRRGGGVRPQGGNSGLLGLRLTGRVHLRCSKHDSALRVVSARPRAQQGAKQSQVFIDLENRWEFFFLESLRKALLIVDLVYLCSLSSRRMISRCLPSWCVEKSKQPGRILKPTKASLEGAAKVPFSDSSSELDMIVYPPKSKNREAKKPTMDLF